MSAKPVTKSRRKLDQWAETAALDRLANRIAAYRGIPLIEAYPEALREMDAEAQKLAREPEQIALL